jgi:hypothetical protein
VRFGEGKEEEEGIEGRETSCSTPQPGTVLNILHQTSLSASQSGIDRKLCMLITSYSLRVYSGDVWFMDHGKLEANKTRRVGCGSCQARLSVIG